MKKNLLKIFITLNICLISSFLFGCSKSTILTTTTKIKTTTTKKPIISNEYTLVDDEGTIKCDNFKYVICIEKEKGKDFKVLNFSDIQLTSQEALNKNNDVTKYSLNLVDEIIDEVTPDLITLSGDQGYGEPNSIKAIGDVIDKYNIPWAPVFGNHDNECRSLSVRDQIKKYAEYPNCIFQYGPREISATEYGERGGNYIINIVERDDDGFHILRSIFMFNSGASSYEVDPTIENKINNTTYEHLTENQIEFYIWGLECAKKYNNGEYPKSTIIEHIPITAYAHAFAEAFCAEYSVYEFSRIVSTAVGYTINESYKEYCWKDGYKDSFGVCYEMVCCSPVDDGIFEIITQYGSLDSMIVGHDHKNNFSINYHGVRLTYGMKSGTGCYFDSNLLGGTILSFDDENNITIEHIYK